MANTLVAVDLRGLVLVDAIGTSNVGTRNGLAQTVDGVALNTAGMLVGLLGQSTGSQNWLYRVKAGDWDVLMPLDQRGFGLQAKGGTANALKTFMLTTATPVTPLGVTAITFAPVGSPSRSAVFTGRNGAGAITISGLKVGDEVVSCVNLTDAADGAANFESVVSTAGQLAQSAATDLSAKKYALVVRPKAL